MTDESKLLEQLRQHRDAQMAMALDVGLRILTQRALTLVALVADAVMFGWAMYWGEWPRLAVAAVFAGASWCLVNFSKGST